MRTWTVADILIILTMICGIFLTFNRFKFDQFDRAVVYRKNSVIAEYPLGNDVTFIVNGKIGAVDVEIKDGAVMIRHVDCPRKICKLSGVIRNPNGQLVCAPNNILIRVHSSKNDAGIDAIAY